MPGVLKISMADRTKTTDRRRGSSKGDSTTSRSKSGCWTCRTRKVKCDEHKPLCNQCKRLNYACDWKPRLHFKHDTSKIIERTQLVSTVGNFVWDPLAVIPSRREHSKQDDVLPPFADLLTDAQREQKADLHDPGTFTVVINPKTFLSLPEYRDQSRGISSGHPPTSQVLEPTERVVAGDGNVIVLRRFEENPDHEATISSHSSDISSMETQDLSYKRNVNLGQTHADTNNSNLANNKSPEDLQDTSHENTDTRLLEHYRNVLAKQICPLSTWEGGIDLFERKSQNFPPLRLAIIALSSLSLACLEHKSVADALERHQSVFSALKIRVQSSEDSLSDEALFTHYFLYRFEVAAAGHRETNMSQYHSDQVFRVLQLRHQAYGPERHAFIIIWAMYIDIYALLATSGTGSFITAIMQENMLPPPERALEDTKSGQFASGLTATSASRAAELLRVNRRLTLIALGIGMKAKELRAEPRDSKRIQEFAVRQRMSIQHEGTLLDDFRDTCAPYLATSETWLDELGGLPTAVFTLKIHPHLLYRACVIYFYTSMYHGQMKTPATGAEEQVSRAAQEILQIASMIIERKRFEFRYIAFPIFLAGFASRNEKDKEVALELIRELEKTSYGMSTQSTRKLLEKICERQRVELAQMGSWTVVNWIEELEESGEKLIIFGL